MITEKGSSYWRKIAQGEMFAVEIDLFTVPPTAMYCSIESANSYADRSYNDMDLNGIKCNWFID